MRLLSFNLTTENRYWRANGLYCDERREHARIESQSFRVARMLKIETISSGGSRGDVIWMQSVVDTLVQIKGFMPSLHSLPPPTKRRKTQKDAEHPQSIKRLEDDLHDSLTKNESLNSLADLLELAYTVDDPHDTSKAIYALYRVFVVIISNNKLDFGGDEAAKVVKAWIWERLQSYVDFLGSLLQDEEKFLRVR